MKSKYAKKQSWDPLAHWYDGWMGQHGSRHHQRLAIPAILTLLEPQPGQRLLDLGAGQGVLAPYIAQKGMQYTGVELSPRLTSMARNRHGRAGTFLQGDARCLKQLQGIHEESFDACVFLLSLQDMDPLEDTLQSAAWALRPNGRLVVLLTHPCFRIPRQSGWGWDSGRKLRFRRIDRYLTPLEVPMKKHPGRAPGVSRSYHRPLSTYIQGITKAGLWVDHLIEIPSNLTKHRGRQSKAYRRADREIPLFLGIRGIKRP
jgi:SAM-dependent methyltransferase